MLNNYVFIITAYCSASLVSSRVIPKDIFNITTKMDETDILLDYGKFMLANMDKSVDPCEDFYEYACGNYSKNVMIPADGRNKSVLDAIELQIDKLIKNFLQDSTSKHNTSAEMKIKKFYSSCIAVKSTFENGFMELTNAIKEPNVKDSNETLDWIYINFYSFFGIYPLLPLKVFYNLRATLQFEIEISPPTAVLNYFDFTNFTKDVHIEEGNTYDEMKNEFKEVQLFENTLMLFSEARNLTETLALSEFITAHKEDQINWERYFGVAFNGTTMETWIVNNKLKSIDELGGFLSKTDKDVLFRYMKWSTIIKFYNIYKYELYINNKSNPSEEKCMELTNKYFPGVITPWFIDTMFDDERRADILKISRSIKDVFNSIIDQCEWMDEPTRSEAKAKLNAMDISVGYTDEERHQAIYDIKYENITISDNFWKNIISLENDSSSRMRSKMGMSENPKESDQSVNAYYSPFWNGLFIYIGMSQIPFYHLGFPSSLKFGGIGTVVGHEMAHGFQRSYKTDYIGKLRNWWSEQSLRNFEERYKCLEAQYNKFVFSGTRQNGSYTLDENMADNIGMRLSYKAYMSQLQKETEADVKPLLDMGLTNRQLFFINFAQQKCTGSDPKTITTIMDYDQHSFGKFRVLGTLMNSPEFSEAFQCKLGATMNPLRKCIIW